MGKSNQVRDLEIYFVVDRLSHKELQKSLTSLYKVMLKNNDIKVTFVSYEREFESRQLTYDYLKEATKVFDQKFFSLSDDDANQVLMQSDEVEKEKNTPFFYPSFVRNRYHKPVRVCPFDY